VQPSVSNRSIIEKGLKHPKTVRILVLNQALNFVLVPSNKGDELNTMGPMLLVFTIDQI